MNKENLCFKHGLSIEEIDKAIHLILDEVPADKLTPKQKDVIFDLLKNGDVERNKEKAIMDNLCFKVASALIGVIPCELCPAKDCCKDKDNPEAEVVDCYQKTMYLMQAFSVSPLGIKATKADFKKALEDLKNNEFFKFLQQKIQKE